jgi:PAS domain S-box-containing protein
VLHEERSTIASCAEDPLVPVTVPGHPRRTTGSEARKLWRLCGLAATIARLGDERRTLRAIVDTAASLTGADTAHLALVDRKAQTLYGVASSGRHRRDAPSMRVEVSRSAAAHQALRQGRPVVVERARGDARVNPTARARLRIGAVAYLPLLSGRQSFGLLILISGRPRAWSRNEIDLARKLASFASVALENHRLLKRLAETEARFRSLVEHIPAIVYACEVEPPYRSFYISPQTRSMLGYPPEAWLEDAGFFMKIIHPEDAGHLVDLATAAVRGGGFARAEYRLLDSRGDVRWFRDEAVLVRDPAGTAVAWHGVLVEITGLKQMQLARRAGRSTGRDAPGRDAGPPEAGA